MKLHHILYTLLLPALSGCFYACTNKDVPDVPDHAARPTVMMGVMRAGDVAASENKIANAIIYPTDNTSKAATGGEPPFCILPDASTLPFIAGTAFASTLGTDWKTDPQGNTVAILPRSYYYYKEHLGTTGREVKLHTFANAPAKAQTLLLNSNLTSVTDLYNDELFFESDIDCEPPFFMTGKLKEGTSFTSQSVVTLTRACAKIVLHFVVDDPNVAAGKYNYVFNTAPDPTVTFHKVNFPLSTYINPAGVGKRNANPTSWARRFIERSKMLDVATKSMVMYIADYDTQSTLSATGALAPNECPRLHLNLPLTVQPAAADFGSSAEAVNPQATVNNWYRLILPLKVERNKIYELTVHILSPGFPDPAYGQPVGVGVKVYPWTDVAFGGDIGNDVTFTP